MKRTTLEAAHRPQSDAPESLIRVELGCGHSFLIQRGMDAWESAMERHHAEEENRGRLWEGLIPCRDTMLDCFDCEDEETTP